MIELITAKADELETLENMVNDFLIKSNGKVIDVIQQKKSSYNNQSGGQLKENHLLTFVIEYEVMKDWQMLFNTITNSAMSYDEVVHAFLKLDSMFVDESVIEQLTQIYSDESIVTELCNINNIERIDKE